MGVQYLFLIQPCSIQLRSLSSKRSYSASRLWGMWHQATPYPHPQGYHYQCDK